MNLNNRSFKVKRLAENQYLYNGDLICKGHLSINLKGTLTVRGMIDVKGMLISDCSIWAEKGIYVGRSILVMGDLHAEESVHAGGRIIVDGSASSPKYFSAESFSAKFVSAYGVYTGGNREDRNQKAKSDNRQMTMEEVVREIEAIREKENSRESQLGEEAEGTGFTVRELLNVLIPERRLFIKPGGRRTYFSGFADEVPEGLMDCVVDEVQPKIEDDSPILGIWVTPNHVWDAMVDAFPDLVERDVEWADGIYYDVLSQQEELMPKLQEEVMQRREARRRGDKREESGREDDRIDESPIKIDTDPIKLLSYMTQNTGNLKRIPDEEIERDPLQELLVEDEEAREAAREEVRRTVSEETEAYLEELRQEKIRQEEALIQPSNHPGRATRAIDVEEDGERLR